MTVWLSKFVASRLEDIQHEKITAIVADDVPELRRYLKFVLCEFNCVVREVRDGTDVLASVENLTSDILFLDLDMPNMSGLEVLAQAGDIKHQPNIIVVTVDTRAESKDTTITSGMQGYTNKPMPRRTSAQLLPNTVCNACTALTLADDDELMRDLLTQVLGKQHCRVVHAVENGVETLSFLRQQPVPDIIVLDINMPVLNRPTTLQKTRASKLRAFCAMLSAHSTFENVKRALDQGADGFVVKPYSGR